MSQGKGSRPEPPDPASASKTPDASRPLWSGVLVPSGNYEYYGPPAPGAVQARHLPGQRGWKPPDWLLEYHGFRPTKPAEAEAAPVPEAAEAPAVQAKSDAGETRSETERVHEAAARGTSGAGGPLPYRDEIQRSFGRH